MLRTLIIALLLVGCGGSQHASDSRPSRAKDCPLDEDFDPPFLEESKPLPKGRSCLAFPLRNADRLSRWFRDLRHTFTPGKHTGIDVPVPTGTIVMAPAKGRVTYARATNSGTNIVKIDIGGGWEVSLVHLRVITVEKGQKVAEGQVIGLSGGEPGDPGAGPCTTGPHLHYSLRYRGKLADPLAYSCAN